MGESRNRILPGESDQLQGAAKGSPTACSRSVYSPAWAVGRERLKDVDVSQVNNKVNPDVWVTDVLWAALQNAISGNDTWVVGGDCNSSETFDVDWQDRNKKRFGIRSSGNAEFLERMFSLRICGMPAESQRR
jgi:hypothetical protein